MQGYVDHPHITKVFGCVVSHMYVLMQHAPTNANRTLWHGSLHFIKHVATPTVNRCIILYSLHTRTPRPHAQNVCLDHGDVCISHGFYDRSQLRIMPETMPRCRVPHHRYRCHSHPTWMPAICHKRTRAQLFVCTKHVRRMLGRVRGAATPRTRRFKFDSARKKWTTRSQTSA